MDEKALIQGLGYGASPYALISSMVAASAHADSKLTTEERAEREERRRILEEERIRFSKISQGICPNCNSKLTRGKKDRKNNYKRTWTCNGCGLLHTK